MPLPLRGTLPSRPAAAAGFSACVRLVWTLMCLAPALGGVPFPACAAAPAPTSGGLREDSLHVAPFGAVHLYRPAGDPAQVVLFASGDGGWNLGVVDMARSLAEMGAVVAGFDLPRFLRALGQEGGDCAYPAADLENLSKAVQKHLAFAEYRVPVLVGYSSGATLVYAALAQAPPTTFRGGVSLGFCPDLEFPRILCRGSGLEGTPLPRHNGYVYKSTDKLEVPWIALQGEIDQVCDPDSTNAFVRRVRNGRIMLLPKVGHGYAVESRWMPQFREAYRQVVAAPPTDTAAKSLAELPDLPLEVVPADTAAKGGGDLVVLHITGDGGWGVTDRGLARELAARGIPVVGLNSLRYFWKARSPDETAGDVTSILRHFLQVWHKTQIVLVGYSFGADALPFVISRLPADLRERVALVVFLGLGATAEFEFHIGSWVGGKSGKTFPVLPEVEKLRGTPMLCFYGRNDSDTLCRDIDSTLVRGVVQDGGHRIGSHFQGIAEEILSRLDLSR
jgi:type IV secretory pathway VirJ component